MTPALSICSWLSKDPITLFFALPFGTREENRNAKTMQWSKSPFNKQVKPAWVMKGEGRNSSRASAIQSSSQKYSFQVENKSLLLCSKDWNVKGDFLLQSEH